MNRTVFDLLSRFDLKSVRFRSRLYGQFSLGYREYGYNKGCYHWYHIVNTGLKVLYLPKLPSSTDIRKSNRSDWCHTNCCQSKLQMNVTTLESKQGQSHTPSALFVSSSILAYKHKGKIRKSCSVCVGSTSLARASARFWGASDKANASVRRTAECCNMEMQGVWVSDPVGSQGVQINRII